jgi:hypothetical protein
MTQGIVGQMFNNVEKFIIEVFCYVDDLFEEIRQKHPIWRKGFVPALADSEVFASAESQFVLDDRRDR